jgi:hypothetical protein
MCVGGLSHNVMCGLGGDVRAAEGCLTRLRVPSPQPFQTALPDAPQNLPRVLPYPILRRLSSTRRRRAAPRSAGLPDLVTSRATPRGKEEGHATMRVSRRLHMSRRRCAPLDPLGCCAAKRRTAPPGARPLSPREDGDRGGHVADLHFTPMCATLLTASEGERHGTHTRAVSSLSQ